MHIIVFERAAYAILSRELVADCVIRREGSVPRRQKPDIGKAETSGDKRRDANLLEHRGFFQRKKERYASPVNKAGEKLTSKRALKTSNDRNDAASRNNP